MTVKSLQIMDCSKAEFFFPKLLLDSSTEDVDAVPMNARETEDAVWGEIGYAFSEPVSRSDSVAEYAPTQVLAEAFRMHGCDGICYKSLLGTGRNFALFDLNAADLINCTLHRAEKISFQFEQAGNTYYMNHPDITKR